MSTTEESEPGSAAPRPPVSRRDFLRRAGKEAVETGARVVPGAALAQAVLGGPEPVAADGGDAPRSAAPAWMRLLARWRADRKTDAPAANGSDEGAP